MKIVVKGNVGYLKLELPDGKDDSFYNYSHESITNQRHKKLIEVIESICKQIKEIDSNASETH